MKRKKKFVNNYYDSNNDFICKIKKKQIYIQLHSSFLQRVLFAMGSCSKY